jgi:hypothetical protein
MPKVSSPGELGIGRGAGKLGALNLPQRRATAGPEAFGGGREVYRYSPEAFGGQTISPDYGTGKSGFTLLAETVAKIADTGFDTALKVDHANTLTEAQQQVLQAHEQWAQKQAELEATVPEDSDPGDYAKRASAAFDDFKTAYLEGKEGLTKQILEEKLGELGLHNFKEATNYQSTRKREWRETTNRVAMAATKETIGSQQSVIFKNPDMLHSLRDLTDKKIEALQLPDDQKIALRSLNRAASADAMVGGLIERDGPYKAREMLARADPEELAGLDFNDLIKYQGQVDREIDHLESEAKADAREAKAEARAARQDLAIAQGFQTAASQDSVTALIDGIHVGRPTPPGVIKGTLAELDAQINAAVEPGNKRRLMDLRQALHAANDGGEYAAVAAALPTPQLQAEVVRLQTTPVDPNERTPEAEKLKTAAKILAEREEAVRTGKVLEYASNSRLLGVPPVEPNWHDPQTAVTLDAQARKVNYLLGRPDDGNYQRLTEASAARIADDINSSGTTDEVFAKLDGYMGRLDDDAKRAWLRELKEKKLSPLVEKAMEARDDRGDLQGAREIVGAMTVKPEDMPKLGTDAADAITTAVNARLTDPGSRASLSARDHLNIRQPDTQRRAADDDFALTWMTKYYVSLGQDADTASKNAERAVFGDGPTAGNDDLQYVSPPQGEDAGEFTDLLERARANFMASEFLPGPGVMPGQDMYRQSELTNIRNNGYWRQGTGGTYELIDPTSRRAVAVYTARQLRELAGEVTDQPIIGY